MLRNVGLRKSVEQPVLDLNFAASQIGSNGAPDSRIDFSRGTNAWFVDADGLVKKSPHNLLPYSEDFTNAVWSKTRCSISSNAGIAPDGTTTADKLVEDSSTNTHFLQEALTIASSTAFTYSVFLKAGERDHANIHMGEGQWKTGGYAALNVDLADGTVSVVDATYVDASSIEDYGNGWFRVSISSTSGSSQTTGVFRIFPTLSNFGTSYAGDGSSGIFVWGAQVSQHYVLPVDNPYVKTEGSAVYAARLDHDPSWFMSAAQEQNLEVQSEDLQAATDLLGRSSITDNDIAAPDGTTTADKLVVDGTAGQSHYMRFLYTVDPSTEVTFSIHAKADELSEFDITTYGSLGFESSAVTTVDLSAGTVTKAAGHTTATIEALDDGWFRVSLTENTGSTDTDRLVQIHLRSGGSQTFDGDSTSGMHFWGVQFEVGSTASTYHRTEGAPYYGEGATPKGLLIEEQRTNLIPNSNALIDNDGLSGGVSNTPDSALGPDGTVTAVKLAANTTTPTNPRVFYPASGITLSAADYTFSIFLKKAELNWVKVRIGVSGNFPGVFFNLDNGTVGTASTGMTGKIVEYGNGWYRCSITAAASIMSASTFFTGVHLATADNTLLSSATVGDGVFMWGYSLELGSFPTSYIETITTSATRNNDVAVMGPTTGGTELVTNGTYDTDTTGWDDFTGRSNISVSSGQLVVDVVDDTRGFVARTDTDGGYDPVVVPGRRYRLSADLKVNSGNGVEIDVYGNGSAIAATGFVTSGTLTTKTVDFTCPDGVTSVTLFVDNLTPRATTDEYVIDNVSLRELYPFEHYNPAEGTVVCEFERNDNTTFDYIWSFGFGTNGQNEFSLLHLDATRIYHHVMHLNAQQMTYSPVTLEPGDTGINAFAYQTNNVNASFSRNGAFVHSVNDTVFTVPGADKFAIGHRVSDIAQCGGHIKRLTYYPYRLNDAVCDSKVSS